MVAGLIHKADRTACDLRQIIVEVQCLGIKSSPRIPARKGGAGPSEGGYLVVQDKVIAVPLAGKYVETSPYRIERNGNTFALYREGEYLVPVEPVRRAKFYDYKTERGVPYWKIALLHGTDCVASSVIQTCLWWNTDKRCRFCGIEISLNQGATVAVKQPEDLAEVAEKAKELDRASHVVLTTGAGKITQSEISTLSKCARAIKQRTGLPIHVQCLPPRDPGALEELREAGVDTIGLHIESFDPQVLSRIAPLKAAIGLNRYEKAWRRAVRIFGVNQVSSFLIVGIGESDRSIAEGSEYLADLGVFPFVVPLRPIPGSFMEDIPPPPPERMISLYKEIAKVLKTKGLSSKDSKAGCVLCGACSALSIYEEHPDIVCYPCRTDEEVSIALELRKEVFVKEQRMFEKSDIDQNDNKSTLLIAKRGEEIVGTVRVYPEGENGHWVGGRLAVKKAHRHTGTGKILVEEAVRYVKRRGCKRFTAHIQEGNVPFFLTLGWKPVGPLELYFGKPHQLMEANLSK